MRSQEIFDANFLLLSGPCIFFFKLGAFPTCCSHTNFGSGINHTHKLCAGDNSFFLTTEEGPDCFSLSQNKARRHLHHGQGEVDPAARGQPDPYVHVLHSHILR